MCLGFDSVLSAGCVVPVFPGTTSPLFSPMWKEAAADFTAPLIFQNISMVCEPLVRVARYSGLNFIIVDPELNSYLVSSTIVPSTLTYSKLASSPLPRKVNDSLLPGSYVESLPSVILTLSSEG